MLFYHILHYDTDALVKYNLQFSFTKYLSKFCICLYLINTGMFPSAKNSRHWPQYSLLRLIPVRAVYVFILGYEKNKKR